MTDVDSTQRCFTVGPDDEGQRLDSFLTQQCPDLSRSRIHTDMKEDRVLVDNRKRPKGFRLKAGSRVVFRPGVKPEMVAVAQDIPLDIVHEDDHILVVDKPVGMVVHPAVGHPDGTLVNALLHHCQDLSGIGGELRPGIVHRLDKDTSGLLIVAKNETVHYKLSDMFKERLISKTYVALVEGRFEEERGHIDLPIGRSRIDRKKMAIAADRGRRSRTDFEVAGEFRQATLLNVYPKTGRTHQIRVHMAEKNCPVAGDEVYGRKDRRCASLGIKRQCLHSSVLAFTHPSSGEIMRFTAPLWPDIASVLDKCRKTNDE